MVYSSVGDHSNNRVVYPFPKDDVFVVDVGFDFLLSFNVEDLKSSCSYIDSVKNVLVYQSRVHTFESKDFLVRVHDCRIRCDGSSKDIVRVCKVNNDNLILLVDFLSDTDEVVAFKCQSLQS